MCGGKRARDNAAMSKGRGGGILPSHRGITHKREQEEPTPPPPTPTFHISGLPPFAIAGKFFCFGARGGEQEKGERKYKIMLYIEAK